MSKKLIEWTTYHSLKLQHVGLALLRISFGIMFVIFGYQKLTSGSQQLTQLGSAMSYFGITHGYLLWGYLAALTELLGGISYFFGFYIRLISLPMIWLLIVAIKFHQEKGDSFTKWSFASLCICIIISFVIMGSGIYSADYFINKNVHQRD